MKSHKVLKYLGILLIVGSVIGFPITNNSDIRFWCCLLTLLGMYALVNAGINNQRYFPNE